MNTSESRGLQGLLEPLTSLNYQRFGRFLINEKLGEGAVGVVYVAQDTLFDDLVAVKLLKPQWANNEEYVKRFLQDAKAMARLSKSNSQQESGSHPNIVRVLDSGDGHGTYYIAMELVKGRPLDKIIESGISPAGGVVGFSEEKIAELGIQIAEALDVVHQQGIIHRDIKPSNLIMQPDGLVKITDFGIAHIDDPSATLQTHDGQMLGTPAYMSPEQVLGKKEVDGRSDLFSLGATLYQLGAGKLPFGADTTNFGTIFVEIVHTNPRELSDENPRIDKTLSAIIMKCLNKNPDDRFQTGSALAGALRDWLQAKEENKDRTRVILRSEIPSIGDGDQDATRLWHPTTASDIPGPANGSQLAGVEEPRDGTRVITKSQIPSPDEGNDVGQLWQPASGDEIPGPSIIDHDTNDTIWSRARRFLNHHKKATYGTLGAVLLLTVIVAIGKYLPALMDHISPPKAYLKIESDPHGAEIYVDDAALKRITPDKLELAPGSHRVRLRHAGRKDWEKMVHLEKGKEHSEHPRLEEVERFALLKLKSTPAGAEVYVDDNPTAKGTTPMELELPLGDHVVSLKKPQYSPWKEKVPLKEEREYWKDVSLERIPPLMAKLKMDSSPLGAELFVDGASKGVTPLMVDLSVGAYTVRLLKEGFKPWEKKIPLNEARLYSENISLEPETQIRLPQVTARIISKPANADLYIDDAPVGKTPITVTMPAGTYSLRMALKDHKPWNGKVSWKRTQETLNAKLDPVKSGPEMATLKVSTWPVSAQLFVNNERKGSTPVTLTLPANQSYNLRMEAAKYQPKAVTVYLDRTGKDLKFELH